MTTTLEHPPVQTPLTQVTGVLDVTRQGNGFLRSANCLPSSGDTQVSAALIRQHALRTGDVVEGACAKQRILSRVERVNGREPGALRGGRTSATSPRSTPTSGSGSKAPPGA